MTIAINNLAFHSAYRYERIDLKSSTAFSIAGGGFASTTVTINHNFGYKPYYKAWYGYGNGKYFQLFSGTASYDLNGNGVQVSNVSMTVNTLIVFLENFGVGVTTGTIYYRIYAEPQL